MNYSRLPWLAILSINAAWVLILPSRGGKLVGTVGLLIATSVLLLPFLSRRASELLEPASSARRSAGQDAVLIAPFLLPALSLVATPRLAFLDLDGRVWLIAAWVSVAVILSCAENPGGPAGPSSTSPMMSVATGLFLLWSAVLWLTILADLGLRRFVLDSPRDSYRSCQSDPLAAVFSIWESTTPSRHLFLSWRTAEDFEGGRVYASQTHPYLFTMYGWVRGIRAVARLDLYQATNTTPFMYIFVLLAAVTTLLARAGLLRDRHRAIDRLLLFLAFGLLITAWRFWNDLYRYSSDNPYPLMVGVFIFVYAFLLKPVRPALAIASAVGFVALSPVYTPMVIVPVVMMFWRPGDTVRESLVRNRTVLTLSVAALATGVAFFAGTRAVIAFGGYTVEGHTFLFRSGLDGDTRYFANMIQAVFAPCPVNCCWRRTTMDLAFPALVPLLAFGALGLRRHTADRIRVGHLVLFLTAPYLMSVVLFPQSVSVHPYMYDNLLLMPVSVGGAVALLSLADDDRMSSSWIFGVLLLMGAVLMSNLIAIAQSLLRMPR